MFQSMFLLVLYTSPISLVSCTEKSKGPRQSEWRAEYDWWEIFPSTPKPEIRDRWDRDDYTLAPDPNDLTTKKGDYSGLYVALIIFIIVAVVIIYLKYVLSKMNMRTLFGSQIARPSQPSSSVPTITRSVTSSNPNVTVDFAPHPVYRPVVPNRSATNSRTISEVATLAISTNRTSTTDKPPGYDDVVTSDLSGNKEFPEVKPSVPETPPPCYEDNNTIQYNYFNSKIN